ncbi:MULTISPECIES: PilZ domain-containing protein [Corallincola]|uniref:PilZ domain-containing protein n=2 Tax=Corallincola TaxID=1775176 RepID=A0A368N3E6_9GAMM|nr:MULTISPECIES: PilZ domain-containing protein [Corallincola]RCU45087.1 PilZ domain-containing protein [Corallincola holothuriorum]TAA46865.1 PilZ domain-containing protein [Corallincola spongiicola]
MISHDDRRNFYRMMVNAEVTLTQVTTDSRYEGTCINLSATGMAVSVDEMIDADMELEARLEAADQMVPALNAKTKVIRCTPQGDGSYMLGLEILDVV